MKIVVAQFYTNNVSYGKYAEAINSIYCSKHEYIYHCEKITDKIKLELEGRAPTWYKPKLIKDVLELYNPDYVLFLDIDAVFTKHHKKIENYIVKDFDLILAQDVSQHSVANAGVIILKNTEWSKKFLDIWWYLGDLLKGKDAINLSVAESNKDVLGYFKNALWHDQTCLTYLYNLGPQFKDHIKIVENTYINSGDYNDHCFIFHAYSFGYIQDRTLDKIYEKILSEEPQTIEVDQVSSEEIDTSYETLSKISKKYPTDKDFTHNYFNTVYERYLSPIKEDVKLVCEIGIGGFISGYWVPGNSLKVFRDYFINAEILGLDIKNYEIDDLSRIKLDWIDQSKKDIVIDYSSKLNNYDLILDDASHNIYDQQITLAYFFRSLKPGGIYILEDLHTSIEVNIPEKAKLWGWGEPGHITPLEILEHFQTTGEIISDYLTDEEKTYLKENIEKVEVFHIGPTSITSVITKKQQ